MTIQRVFRVLVFNPNTSQSVTDSFIPILSQLDLADTVFSYWTCPTGPTLIKTQADMFESASHCLPLLLDIADEYDGFLGACYADHPIVRLLQTYVHGKPVVGIFDASILAASHLVPPDSQFGIVTTGRPFEALLADAVEQSLKNPVNGSIDATRCHFAGVAASGIGAGDLSVEAQDTARDKVMAATTTLLRSHDNVQVICVGGVILAGMEHYIREACVQELGVKHGHAVIIIDQLKVGALVLDAILRNQSHCDFSPAFK